VHLDLTDLIRFFDQPTYGRGEDYFKRGKVTAVRREDDRLIGEVDGSGRDRYRQSIRVRLKADRLNIEGSCTCPVGYNCKHVVATLLASIAADGQRGQPARSADAHQRWLGQLALLNQAMQPRARPMPTFVLAWIMAPDLDTGREKLHLRKARPSKKGGIGATSADLDAGSLLRSAPAWITPADVEPLRLFHALSTGWGHAQAVLPEGAIGARLLRILTEAGSLSRAPSFDDLRRGLVMPLRVGPVRKAALGWHAVAGDQTVRTLGWHADDARGADELFDAVLPTEPPSYLSGDLIGELHLSNALSRAPLPMLVELVAQAPSLQPGQEAAVAQGLREQGLDAIVPLPPLSRTTQRSDIVPLPCLALDSMEVGYGRTHAWLDFAVLLFEYGDVLVGADDGTPQLRRIVDDGVELIARDFAAESNAARMLGNIGFSRPPADSPVAAIPGAWELDGQDAWVAFERHTVPRLIAAGWMVDATDDYRYNLLEIDDWYADLEEKDEGGQDWFSLELGIVVDGERYPLLPLLLQMIRTAPHDFHPAALAARADDSELLVTLEEAVVVTLPWNRIRPILATLGELYFSDRIGKGIHLPWMDAARLAELERAAQLRWFGGERLRELGSKLLAFDGIAPAAPPAGLQAALRPYQQSGLAWLQFLREYGFGGILADDMGLGKTIQTLAHILLEKEAGRLDRPALVVAPTSVMPNWQAEAARFAPGLRVLLLHGKDRHAQFDAIDGADLVLTTYALLGRDEEQLRARRFHLLILDEAQNIKNSRSKAAQTARLLEARHRLCLTGTPVQNHLGELWSQFHFLMPGLLGDERSFNRDFRKPIEGGADAARKDLLVRRLKPFMLRRTKDKVATELPPKTEIVLPVDLGGTQRDLYETVRVAMDRKVRDEIDRKGLARSHIVILEALLKLRQVCCDPRLLKRDGVPATASSAKLEALMELLETLRSEGRRTLVFSQFTSMLDLIAGQMREREIDYVTLTGDTVDRAAPVAAFQGGQVGVFLISLKAGGVGLNLTAADTVIHYDPWWNPASENQATDRAWRIGQEQPVFVYKLIARGTLEEKIQEMQWRKGELAQAVLQSESELTPRIGADELQAIFGAAPL